MDDARHNLDAPAKATARPPATAWAWQAALSRSTTAIALLMLIALAHGLFYAFATPIWQSPDEPMIFEYVALTAELGRIPASRDASPALQQRIVASLVANHFWFYRGAPAPESAPVTFADLARTLYMPRQVGGDPPVYFALAALPLRLAAGWSIEAQVYLLRVLNVLLLPLGVACVYLAAQEAVASPETPRGDLRRYVPAAAAALVALQPMYVFIGAMASNDGLANLLGALLCLLVARAVRRGLRARDLLVITLVAVVGLQTKRTIVPYALLAAALWAIWAARLAIGPRRLPARRRWLRAGLGLAGLCAALGLAVTIVAGQLAWDQAARWFDARTLLPMGRAADGAGHKLVVEPGQEVIQVLPDVATAFLRNGAVQAGARVWGDGPVAGRLVVYTGARRQEFAFSAERMSTASMRAAIPTSASDVRFGIVADSGRLYVADLWMRGSRLNGNLVTNGDLSRPAIRYDSALIPLTRYLRVEEFLWVLQSGRLGWGLAVSEWWRWLFVSFWGQLGWMQIAVVRDTWREPAIYALMYAGLAGVLAALARGAGVRRGVVATLCGAVALAFGPIFVNALVDMYPIQQGRYLFPVLPALAPLMALGQAALLPARFRGLWLITWLAFWTLFACAGMLRLVSVYYG